MDQELKAYLEEMEGRMEARAGEREVRMNERIVGLEARMDERIIGLEARMDERIVGLETRMDGRIVGLETRMDERLGKVETESRQTRVLLEGVHDKIRLLGEGVMGVTERLETYQAETARGFQEIKEILSPYYRNLNGRAQGLEDDVRCLDRRVKVLEGRADRQTGDVLDAIRKEFGRPESQ